MMVKYFCDICEREMPFEHPSIVATATLKSGSSVPIVLEPTSNSAGICHDCLWRIMKAKIEGPDQTPCAT